MMMVTTRSNIFSAVDKSKSGEISGPMHYTATQEPLAIDVIGDLEPNVFTEMWMSENKSACSRKRQLQTRFGGIHVYRTKQMQRADELGVSSSARSLRWSSVGQPDLFRATTNVRRASQIDAPLLEL